MLRSYRYNAPQLSIYNVIMNLIRLIAIAVVFWLLYRLILALLVKTKRPAVKQQTRQVDNDTMVKCEVCGLHVPQSEALEKSGKHYCCEAHRDADDSWQRDE